MSTYLLIGYQKIPKNAQKWLFIAIKTKKKCKKIKKNYIFLFCIKLAKLLGYPSYLGGSEFQDKG